MPTEKQIKKTIPSEKQFLKFRLHKIKQKTAPSHMQNA